MHSFSAVMDTVQNTSSMWYQQSQQATTTALYQLQYDSFSSSSSMYDVLCVLN